MQRFNENVEWMKTQDKMQLVEGKFDDDIKEDVYACPRCQQWKPFMYFVYLISSVEAFKDARREGRFGICMECILDD